MINHLNAEFAATLLKSIRECCSHPRAAHSESTRMWEKFSRSTSSVLVQSLEVRWMEFLQGSNGFTGSPIFYQFVTRVAMEDTIKTQFPMESQASEKSPK